MFKAHSPALFALAVLGCGGSASTPVSAPPPVVPSVSYAHISGVIQAETVAPTGQVRLALAWYRQVPGATGTDEGGDRVMVTQDIPIAGTFPAAFQIDVTQLPPASAMNNGLANAAVVVYEDTNGNGTLDFTPPGESSFRDHLLGTPGEVQPHDYTAFEIVYAASADAAAALGVPQGFSILQSDWKDDGTVSDTALPTTTSLTIHMSGDPAASCYLVDPLPSKLPQGPVGLGYEAAECVGNTPPSGSTLSCAPYAGASFYQAWTAVPTSPAISQLCGDAFKVCLIDAPSPANLSCP